MTNSTPPPRYIPPAYPYIRTYIVLSPQRYTCSRLIFALSLAVTRAHFPFFPFAHSALDQSRYVSLCVSTPIHPIPRTEISCHTLICLRPRPLVEQRSRSSTPTRNRTRIVVYIMKNEISCTRHTAHHTKNAYPSVFTFHFCTRNKATKWDGN